LNREEERVKKEKKEKERVILNKKLNKIY